MLLPKVWILFGIFVIRNAKVDGKSVDSSRQNDESRASPPPAVVEALKSIDDWSFDTFAFAKAANGQALKYITQHLFNSYGIMEKFKIDPGTLDRFLNNMQEGYSRFNNSYHNNLHATDITQTMHFMISKTGLRSWMTDLEIFASLLAPIIHDYEHMGISNKFHVITESYWAMTYNDRSVNENHHVSAVFTLLKENDDCNILSNLNKTQYRQLRAQVIEMVLSTDMHYHTEQLKKTKEILATNATKIDKSKSLGLVMHSADISNPAKKWALSQRWTTLVMQEFFYEGDRQKQLGLPVCALCDRDSTVVPKAQIYFIENVVQPTLVMVADLIQYLLTMNGEKSTNDEIVAVRKLWIEIMEENKKSWNIQEER